MKYAIDKPDYQQFYVRYEDQKEKVNFLNFMMRFGFLSSDHIRSVEYKSHILIINYLQKNIIGAGAAVMACACTSGAKIVTIDQFIKEILLENLDKV
jgi:hypothetical protein